MAKVSYPVQRRGLGGVLRVAGWLLRLVGSAAVLISGLRIRGVVSATSVPGYNGFPWYVLLFIYIGVMFVGGVAFVASLVVGRRARVHMAHIVTSVSSLAPGSYVLYLRPFTQDLTSAGIAPAAGNQNAFNNPAAMIMRSGRTYEERLGRMFRKFGPLVAVGRPGEPLPGGSGANRTYLPVNDWKNTVRELLDNARVIILGAGPGPGTVWEYVEILRRRDPSQLVVLVTNPAEYQRFKTSTIAETEGVLFELKARYGDRWEAPVLPDLPKPANPKATLAFYFRAMIYFTADWEPHLAHFDRSAVKSTNARKVGKYYKERLHPVMTHLGQGSQSPVLPSGADLGSERQV